jgi:hypothetical protein
VLASGLAQRRIAQGFGFHKLVASAAFGQIASRAVELPTPPLVAGFAVDLTRAPRELVAENALLRQQLPTSTPSRWSMSASLVVRARSGRLSNFGT